MSTKLWISDKLELRFSPNGWPQRPINEDDYQKALDKAKSESLVVNGFPEGMTLLNIATRDLKPGDFIDLPIEVEIGWQYYAHEWRDCIGDPMNYLDYMTRQVARLKPVNSAHSFTEAMSETEMNAHLDALENKPTHGLKARILAAFHRKISMGEAHWEIDREMKQSLAEVLDELGIK